MEPNIITLTDQYGESVRFELLDIVEYEGLDDEDLINAVFDLFCERNDFE